ncbi:MAG: hypothetical protein LC739_12785 [Actinobacteria bacterium]|nr:hypothetical protein [Actinomycetota bacterium]
MIRAEALLLLALVSMGVEELTAQTPPDTGTTVILAGRLFDSRPGTFEASQQILVQADSITAVGIDLPIPVFEMEPTVLGPAEIVRIARNLV